MGFKKGLKLNLSKKDNYLFRLDSPNYWGNYTDIIFSSSIGFYHLVNKRANLNFDFKRVGYDRVGNAFLWKDIAMGDREERKMVVYS